MRRALELAARGIGHVEPNPAVGAIVVDEGRGLLGEGYHQSFGQPHAEIIALAQAEEHSQGASLFVTLEPCCHHGKTPPCTSAVIDAGIQKVVVGIQDPSPHADGNGIAQLQAAGIEVEVGLLEDAVSRLNAPFVKLATRKIPFVLGKWAMTLDGKIASKSGSSRWISSKPSREIVHRLRGRMDAIVVGITTALADDPLLTARPAGPRVATRIVLDSECRLPVGSQLARTVDQAPLLVVASNEALIKNVRRLKDAGVEVLQLSPPDTTDLDSKTDNRRLDLEALLSLLGERGMTNVLVEGGGELLGSFFDQKLIDELHVFIAQKIVGGRSARTPIAGIGHETISQLPQLRHPEIEIVDGDVYIHGMLC